MAKASLPEIRKPDADVWRERIGGAIRIVRGAKSLKEFAVLIDRDERQVARWEDGKERPQFDALFAVETLHAPVIAALADLTSQVEKTILITIKRTA